MATPTFNSLVTKDTENDPITFNSLVTKYKKNDPMLQFDLKVNLSRLEQQIGGDSAFYFLAIISFIEGYFRDTYKRIEPSFDFNNENKMSLRKMFDCAKKNISKIIPEKELSESEKKELNLIFKFMRWHSDGVYDKDNNRWEQQPTKFYIDGDRIRHCFCRQDDNNIRALVSRFVEFSKIYGFYDEYEKEINKHLHTPYFEPLKKHESEDSSLSDEMAKGLIKLINNGSTEDKEKASENFYETQAERAMYARTWRDYQKIFPELTEEQQIISDELLGKIEKDKSIKKLIKGGPGTGKTLILINILQETLDKEIRLLTYTKSLTKYNKYLSNVIAFNGKKLDATTKKEVSERILGFDEYLIDVVKKAINKEIIPLIKVSGVKKICDKYNIAEEDLFVEAKEIWLHLPEQKKYVDHTYSQPKAVDKAEQENRQLFWDAVSDLDKVFELVDSSFVPFEWVLYRIYKKKIHIPEALKCDYLLIDEIQDLEAAKIEAIKQLSRKGYVFTGDKTQSVFVRKGLPWGWLTKQFPTTKEGLTKNFRSTKPIQDLANEYRKRINLKDPEAVSIGFMPGPIPEAYISKAENVVFDKLLERIKFIKDQLFFDNGEFCIVASNDKILDKINAMLSEQGLKAKSIESDDYDFNDDRDFIKLSKIKYVKGIDIPVIFLVLDDDFLDESGKRNDGLDIYSQENSIYTCISRAMNILNVFFIDNDTMLTNNNAVCKLHETMKDTIVELKTGN